MTIKHGMVFLIGACLILLGSIPANAQAVEVTELPAIPAQVTPPDIPVNPPPMSCDIDLSGTIALLVQAQAAASSGDSVSATQKLAEARVQLENLQAQCGVSSVITEDDIITVPLGESYTLAADNGMLSFNYPSGWILGEPESDSISVASSPLVLAEKGIDQSSLPTYAPGEGLLGILLTDTSFFDLDDMSPAPDAETLLTTLASELASLGEATGVTTLTLADRPAAQVRVYGDGYEIVFVLVDMGVMRNDYEQFGLVVGIAAPGELRLLQHVVLSVAASLKLA